MPLNNSGFKAQLASLNKPPFSWWKWKIKKVLWVPPMAGIISINSMLKEGMNNANYLITQWLIKSNVYSTLGNRVLLQFCIKNDFMQRNLY